MDRGDGPRVRPTASNRRRLARRVNDVPKEPDVPDTRMEEGNDDVGFNESAAEEMTGPIPGGPADPSLLSSFCTHMAAYIWQDERCPLLRCLSHGGMVGVWALNVEAVQNNRLKELVAKSGLAPLLTSSYRYVNKSVVSSFVERWQPATNTFHLPFGEMTITLDDVAAILHIPVIGRSVSYNARLTFVDAQSLLVSALGVELEEAHDELVSARGQLGMMEWLRSRFSEVSDAHPKEMIMCAARAYLLYLLGCTLFTDKSAVRVPIIYLTLLTDLDMVRSYTWGAATLAYLYRQLGLASRYGVRQIADYLTLLEAWVYKHFEDIMSNPYLQYSENQPRAHLWIPRRESGEAMSTFQALREKIDMMSIDRVI